MLQDLDHDSGKIASISPEDPLAPNGAVRWIGPELLDLKKPKTLREALPAPVKPPAKGRVRCCKIWIMAQKNSQA